MVRVCLIPLVSHRSPWPADRLGSFCRRLTQAGYQVQLDVPGEATLGTTPVAPELAATAWQRLQTATGTYLVVINMARAYTSDDVLAVVRRLEQGATSLVVGVRPRPRSSTILYRRHGASDPTSGLVGLTRGAVRQAVAGRVPRNSRFVRELLNRVPGEQAEVVVSGEMMSARVWTWLDTIRQAKRRADRRLGNLSRLVQFCFVGASGMVIDLSVYAALQALLMRTWLGTRMLVPAAYSGVPISLAVAIAAVLAIAVAMTWNFSLNRRLTFNDARRGSIARQYLRYVLSNLVGVGVSLTFRLLLPSSVAFFAEHKLLAAVAGIVAATGISFSLARWFVFGMSAAEANPESQSDGSRGTSPNSRHRSGRPGLVTPATPPAEERLSRLTVAGNHQSRQDLHQATENSR